MNAFRSKLVVGMRGVTKMKPLSARSSTPRKLCSQPPQEPKFHPPHPTVMQRLTQIEDSLRFRGYSVIRIGAAVILVAGGIIYVLREDIRDNVADEVSTVASRSLGAENVQQKAQELAKALLQQLLNDPTVRTHTVQFLRDIFSQPDTVSAVVDLLKHVLSRPESKENLVVILKHILSESLKDEEFRQTLALHLRYVLENENARQGLVSLLEGVMDDEHMRDKFKTFCQQTLASDVVLNEATQLGRGVVENLVADAAVQQKTGDGLWNAIGYSITPGWFRKQPPEDSTSSATQTAAESGAPDPRTGDSVEPDSNPPQETDAPEKDKNTPDSSWLG